MTGYPSIDKPWLRYYKKEAVKKAECTPMNRTFYRFYMENVFTNPDFPILKYFNAVLTTRQFLTLIEMWARAFCAVGVKEDEMVPVYGTWCPEIAAIFFALNAIGAHPYFQKLDITADALRTETIGAKIGVVFEPLWNDVAKTVFTESRFEKVFFISLADSMRFPLKQIVMMKGKKVRKQLISNDHFIFMDQMDKLASGYTRPFEVPFKKDRIAVITTSSGTTSSMVKGIMDTNESALANVIGTAVSEPGFISGKECLITLPPTASTAINCFYLLPLYMGMTVRIDPRADEENWVNLILKYKPSLTASTGSMWYSFFRRIEKMRKVGKKIDLSFLDTFILGGSGVNPEQLAYINRIAVECHVQSPMDSGYGCSEFFGVISVDKHEIDYKPDNKDVIDVGIPIPGATVAVFDEAGNELSYGQRGELRVKGPSVMHGYFGKPDITEQMLDGVWLKTGDICEIDENGYIYCYGRIKSSIEVDGKRIYLFDVANALRRKFRLEDCMLEAKTLKNGTQSIVVYFVQKSKLRQEKKQLCLSMDIYVKTMGVIVDGYLEFEEAFPISPTTLKPKTRYTEGFVSFSPDGKMKSVSYLPAMEQDVWDLRIS